MGHYILRLTDNREEYIGRPIHELTEDIADTFSLMSIVSHIGVNQNAIHNSEEDGDDDSMIYDAMIPSQDLMWIWSLSTCYSLIISQRIWRRPGGN